MSADGAAPGRASRDVPAQAGHRAALAVTVTIELSRGQLPQARF
jgi:hypothetical protein